MNSDDKKELDQLNELNKKLKYTLIGSLTCTGLAIPFLYLVLENMSLVYPMVISIIGGIIGFLLYKVLN